MEIIKANITQQVIEYIKQNIEDGIWEVGHKIPSENELTKLLQVSRPSIRVALQQFIAIGALVSVHGKGTFVSSNDLRAFVGNVTTNLCDMRLDIEKALQFRMIIEPESCYLAALHASSQNISNLEHYLEQMIVHIGNSDLSVINDIHYHMELAKASENRYIESSLAEVFKEKIRDHKVLNEIYGYKDGIYYHNVILKAIKEKKAKLAKNLMKEHIEQSLNRPVLGQMESDN